MKNKLLLVFVLSSLITVNLNSQSLKIRFDVSHRIGFSSYSSGFNMGYRYEKPWPKGEYLLEKWPYSSYWFRGGVSIEKIFRSKHHLELGFLHNETADLYGFIKFLVPYPILNELSYMRESAMPISSLELAFYKIQLSYSTVLNNKRQLNPAITIGPMFGINYLWRERTLQGELLGKTGVLMVSESGDTIFNANESYYSTGNCNTFNALVGLYVRINYKNRELFGIKVYYEQGFNAVAYLELLIEQNNKLYREVLFTKGSGLYFKVSVPITISKSKRTKS
jgi:hypothetical protein